MIPSCTPRRSAAALALCLASLAQAPAAVAAKIEFNRDIRPILSDRCFFCHGPDEDERKADLRLDTRGGALEAGAIVPGDPDASELIARVSSTDPDDVMPPEKANKPTLTADEVQLLRRWIEQGAEYQGHWAFEPVADPAPPAVPGAAHPVDAFVRARLADEGIEPSPRAKREILIRRVYLDLVGLLPDPDEVDAFVADPDPSAYDKLVDRLLASPHHGERWGRHWLDGARYADSHGYSIDGERQMWPFRDWVIRAINDDMPFDQFTIEQLAGDLLPAATKAQLVASAFHRNTLINQEGGSDPEQFRVEAAMDRVNTTGAVWLGLTLSCAQCHTHKFDPIPHEDYYRLFAFFNSGLDRNNAGATVEVAEGEMFHGSPLAPRRAAATTGSVSDPEWRPLDVASARPLSAEAELVRQPDGSHLLTGRADAREVFTVRGPSPLDRVAALRLRVLTHESLPARGPGGASNGNFVLTAVRLFVDGKEQALSAATADHAQPGYPAEAAIDGDPGSGWAINVGAGQRAQMNAHHELVVALAEPVAAAGKQVEVRLAHERNEGYPIGRFAIDLAADAAPLPAAPARPARSGKVMVMRDTDPPRDTYLLTRGDFTRPDRSRGKLDPGVLSAIPPQLPPAAEGDRLDRLDLARWLVDPRNPLTPRVTVNRIWMRYFGTGLVETEEDFGTQGALPSHPHLLDFLARSFIEGGWSMKQLHRLIVTSETYKQSSRWRRDLQDRDPRNRLLARQSRLRLDAEIIRDAALSASGLLHAEIGGPSVFPPQPDGIYAFTQNRKNWRTSTGADRYRRAMYTMFYRSAPHPLFGIFDAPDFQTTCTRRARSNTPLQALNLANDPAFLEFAQALAARAAEAVAADPSATDESRRARLALVFRMAVSRAPDAAESSALRDYFGSAAASFAGDPEAARALVTDRLERAGLAPQEAAALVATARAVLNTDSFITRE